MQDCALYDANVAAHLEFEWIAPLPEDNLLACLDCLAWARANVYGVSFKGVVDMCLSNEEAGKELQEVLREVHKGGKGAEDAARLLPRLEANTEDSLHVEVYQKAIGMTATQVQSEWGKTPKQLGLRSMWLPAPNKPVQLFMVRPTEDLKSRFPTVKLSAATGTRMVVDRNCGGRLFFQGQKQLLQDTVTQEASMAGDEGNSETKTLGAFSTLPAAEELKEKASRLDEKNAQKFGKAGKGGAGKGTGAGAGPVVAAPALGLSLSRPAGSLAVVAVEKDADRKPREQSQSQDARPMTRRWPRASMATTRTAAPLGGRAAPSALPRGDQRRAHIE